MAGIDWLLFSQYWAPQAHRGEVDLQGEPSRQTRRDEADSRADRLLRHRESEASGNPEVYVRPFAGPGATTRISRAGGTLPVWAPDGASLLYSNEEGHILEVEVTTGEDLKASAPVEVFLVGGEPHALSPAPDGLRFLTTLLNLDAEERQIRVMFDWLAARAGAPLR